MTTETGRNADRTRFRTEQLERQSESNRNRPHRPRSKCVDHEGDGGKVTRTIEAADGEDKALYSAALLEAYGTRSMAFLNDTSDNWLRVMSPTKTLSTERYDAATAIMAAVEPQNELEATLASQMVASNECAFFCMIRFKQSEWPEHAKMYGDLANKFMRTFTAQTEALAKMRRGGEQIIKHVYVQEGGQAVFAGTVNSGVGGKTKNDERPHGASATAASPALLGADTAWNGVPIPGDAERAVPEPRRTVTGSAQGEPECVEARPSIERGGQAAKVSG